MDEMLAARACAVCHHPMVGNDQAVTVGQLTVHLACYPPRQRAQSAAGRGSPVCPLCQIPLVAGDHVIDGRDTLVHAGCHERAHAGTLLAGFLAAHLGERFCPTCLAAHLARPLDQVRKTIWAFSGTPGFCVRADTCSACKAARITIVASCVPSSVVHAS